MVLVPQIVAKPQAAAELQAEYGRLTAEAAISEPGWRPKQPATGSLVFVAPDQYSGSAAAGAPVSDARKKQADALFDLAKRAAEAGQLSLAYQWATEAVRENPDHADARRVLGYEQHNGQWLTPFAKRMVDAGKVWDPRFGWIAAEDVPRYEKGERLVGKQWVTAEVDAARRTRIEDGWQVRTDHFLVTSNKSLEAAAELAARLERLHQVWQQLFAGFWTSEQEVKGLFAGERLARERHQPFHVFYHRDRDDYNATLKREQPRVVETLGIYFDTHASGSFLCRPRSGRRHDLSRDGARAVSGVSVRGEAGGGEGQLLDRGRDCDLFRDDERTSRPEGGSVLYDRAVVGGSVADGPGALAEGS